MRLEVDRVNLYEKDIEDYIYENPQGVRFNHFGTELLISEWIGRQMQLPSGVADLVGRTEHGSILVLEIKNVTLDGNAVAQVCRYAHDIEQAAQYAKDSGPFTKMNIYKFIIGPSAPTKVMHECYAMNVKPITFEPSLHVSFNGVVLSSEYLADMSEILKEVPVNYPALDDAVFAFNDKMVRDDSERWDAERATEKAAEEEADIDQQVDEVLAEIDEPQESEA